VRSRSTSVGAPIPDALGVLDKLRQREEILGLADGRATTRLHRTYERQTVASVQRLAATKVQRLDLGLTASECD
jgi:hypothetical protein